MGPKTLVLKASAHSGWLICGIASLFYLYEFAQITVFNSLSTQIMQRYSIDATQLSSLSAMYYYINVLLLIPAGFILDKYSVKRSMLIAMAISMLGTMIFAFSSSFLLSAVGRAISGVGGAFSFLSCMKLIISWMSEKKIAFSISCLITVGFFGGILVQIPFAILSEKVSLHASLSALVFFGFIIWCLIAFFVDDGAEQKKNNDTPFISLLRLLLVALKNKQTWFCGGYISLMNLPVLILAALWSNLYLEEVSHFSHINASVVSSFLILGIAVGSPLVGRISEIISSKRLIMFVGSLSSFVVLYGIIFMEGSFVGSIVMFFALGLFSSTQCLGYPLIIENNSEKSTAVVTSIASILVLGGGAFLKVLFGFILDFSWDGKMSGLMKVYSKGSFDSALNLILFCFIVSGILTFLIKEKSSEKLVNEELIS
jgi:MFS family permease